MIKLNKLLSKKIVLQIALGGFLIGVLLLAHPYIVKIAFGQQSIDLLTSLQDLNVGVKQDENGYSQISYKIGSRDIFVSVANNPNANPVSSGNYVAWMGQIDGFWQIFLYNVSTEKISQITRVGNNVNPDLYQGKIVWESQVNGIWQIMFFDGVRVSQLTQSNYPSQAAKIDEDYISYSQMEESSGDWKVYLYKISTGRHLLLTPEGGGVDVDVQDGIVYWRATGTKAPNNYYYDILNDSINLYSAGERHDGNKVFDEGAFQEFFNSSIVKDVASGSIENPVVFTQQDIVNELNFETSQSTSSSL